VNSDLLVPMDDEVSHGVAGWKEDNELNEETRQNICINICKFHDLCQGINNKKICQWLSGLASFAF
jgi:hypothetical protein